MKISVAMTTCNGATFLRPQLDSLRTQLRPLDELVICDDCSSDDTWRILEQYQRQYPHFPMLLHRNRENLGFQKNFRQALKLCSGDILFFCDQDDIWEPQKILLMCRLFRENPQMQALASSFTMIDAEGRPAADPKTRGWSNHNLYHGVLAEGALTRVDPEKLLFQNICQGCALAFRAGIRERFLDSFAEKPHYDWQLNLLAASSGALFFLNEPLFRYRIHNANALGLRSNAAPAERLTLPRRAEQTREALAAAVYLRRIAPDAADADPRIARKVRFLKRHLHYLENRKTIGLLFLLADPLYYELRQSWRGRAADLLYSLRG